MAAGGGGSEVSLSALDLFANALGAVAFLLLLFAATSIELARPSALKILTQRVPPARAGAEYLGVLAVQGGVPPYRWTIPEGSLPEGLRLIAERGEIEGAAAASAGGQQFRFVAEVHDDRGRVSSASYEMRVLPASSAASARLQAVVVLTRGNLPDAAAGRPYSLYLSARGGSGRYVWSVEGLPEGMRVDPRSGLLEGSPAGQSEAELVLRVRDESEGAGEFGTAVATATLRVVSTAPGGSVAIPPRILTGALPAAMVGEPYQLRLAGTGSPPLRWSAEGLPADLAVSEDGNLSGTPAGPAEAQLVLRLRDGAGLAAPPVTLALVIRPHPVSLADKVADVGLLAWLGYVLLGFMEIGFLFLLRIRAGRVVQDSLSVHGVHLIQKPDGKTGLSGPPEATQAVERELRSLHASQRRQRLVSYFVLAGAVVGYTIYVLG